MLIFIDESGDAGFRIKKGSSKCFAIGLVIFDDDLHAEETALIIKKYRRAAGLPDHFEFKFNKCNKALRLGFLEAVKRCKFRIRAIVVEKEKIYSSHLRGSKEKFYNFVMMEVLRNNGDTIKNAKIRLDKLGEKALRKNLSTYLRKQLNIGEKSVIENLRFRDSKTDVLIQLADMVVGAIRRSYDYTKTDHTEYKAVIKKRIEDIWPFC